jgi:CRP/FNR family cyclic AMP-dependent transcriptional regulator
MTQASIADLLSKNAFFAGLAPEFIDFLASHAHSRRLKDGEVLFRHGQRASHFYLVLSGTISVEVAAIEGPALELQNLGSGAILGWSWLIPPYEWSFQARATAPAEILEFDGAAVLSRCESDSKFGYEFLKRFSSLMSERLHFARRKMIEEWNPPGFA